MTEDSVRSSTITKQQNNHQTQIEADSKERLIVPDKLTKPDPLVISTRERFAAIKKRDWSIAHDIHHRLNIKVSEANESRALRFFDTLIKALRARKHEVQADDDTKIVVYGESMEIRLRERDKMIKEVKDRWTNTRYVPTGLLYFGLKAGWREKTWSDGAIPLEQKISAIIAYIEMKGAELQKESIEREIANKKREEQERIKKALQERQDTELNNFKLLLKKTERWQQLKLIRGYIDELESKSIERNLLSEEIVHWIEWARKKADWYDPQINAEDELLRDVDREVLVFRSRSQSRW